MLSDRENYQTVSEAFLKHISAPEILLLGNYFNPAK